MHETKNIKNHLSQVQCSKCSSSLDAAALVSIEKMPFVMLANAICAKCNFENVLTISASGTTVLSMVSDLTTSEIKKFIGKQRITANDVIEVHKSFKKDSLCSLLHKKEKN